ncbi:MAG TPA: lipoprotein insertase outer membrane protein LolB [Acidiferrobacterales bacterium]|nr:lipoprotein insertase outer membrane protein LolB [Acidiferrobacterales bacterium]
MKRRFTFLFLLFSFLCFSCAAPLPRPPADHLQQLWETRESALVPIRHWELRGRLAVRADERGGQASLTWKRAAAQHDIRLNGPLGRGVVRVTQNETGAQLQDAEQRVFHAANAEELLYRYTGWRLPLTNLNYWVRGVPVPGLPASRELDDAGRLKTLRQQGWELQYQEYVRFEGHELPNRLTLTYAPDQATPELPAMEVRLVIDRWAQVQ